MRKCRSSSGSPLRGADPLITSATTSISQSVDWSMFFARCDRFVVRIDNLDSRSLNHSLYF